MADSKLRAEWFWTDRWMGSDGYLLPMEARGLYREMLTQSWARGAALPADHEAIRRACGCTEAEWDRCWPMVEKFWRRDGDKLVNDTQLEVYAECQGKKVAASDKARKAAQARWEQCSSITQAKPKQSPPSPSPSPSKEQTPEPEQNGSTPPSPRKRGASRDSLDVFRRWQEVMGHPQAKLTPKRRRRIDARLAEGYCVEQLMSAIDGCRASPYHQGQNETATVYDDIELICRSGEKVEQFIGYLESPRVSQDKSVRAAQQFLSTPDPFAGGVQ